jgi:hypothetical protein
MGLACVLSQAIAEQLQLAETQQAARLQEYNEKQVSPASTTFDQSSRIYRSVWSTFSPVTVLF